MPTGAHGLGILTTLVGSRRTRQAAEAVEAVPNEADAEGTVTIRVRRGAWPRCAPLSLGPRPNAFPRAESANQLTGYSRGLPFFANRLVHLPGYGDFQLRRIEAAIDPDTASRTKASAAATMDLGDAVRDPAPFVPRSSGRRR